MVRLCHACVLVVALVDVYLVAGCDAEGAPPRDREPAVSERGIFVDEAETSGVSFVHDNGATGRYHMVEILGSGVALLDWDNDGDLDLYFVQGGALEGPSRALDRLYRNESSDGRLRFQDATLEAGLEAETGSARGYGIGVATGDFDRDGWVDLYVTEYGRNRLLRNTEGRFVDVTDETGVVDPGFSTTATFFDYDGDGWLDLFVGNYVDYVLEGAPRCNDMTGAQDYCGPGRFLFQGDRLWRNTGGGRFEDVTQRSGLDRAVGPALGSLAFDYDDNGTLDLYVAQDAQPNLLWSNRGDGTFEEVALVTGAALNREGRAEASMGVAAADPDRDGDFDLVMTHQFRESNTLYENRGGLFEDRSASSGLGSPSLPFTGFGTAWEDFDGDGRLDLLVANGAIARIEELSRGGDPFPFHQRNQLFLGRGDGGFDSDYVELTAEQEPSLALSRVGRGLATGDLDDDGDLDVVVSNNGAAPRILRNRSDIEATGWLGLRVLARQEPPIEAIGALVALLVDGEVTAWRRVHTDGSYASAHDSRLLFSLPPGAGQNVSVRVRWPDGSVEDFRGLTLGRYQPIARGQGELR